jgi:hypothetical protein
MLATAPPAAADSGYRCRTHERSLDMPYAGPWPDNYNFDVKVCIKRQRQVWSYMTVSWDAPTQAGHVDAFDGGRARMVLRRPDSGPDTIIRMKTISIGDQLNDSGSGGGSVRLPTIRTTVGSTVYLGGQLLLNWNDDGDGEKRYDFGTSPRV